MSTLGADDVRRFVRSAGLRKTLVPESTRAFAAYLYGAPNYLTISWHELEDLLKEGKLVNPFLNPSKRWPLRRRIWCRSILEPSAASSAPTGKLSMSSAES